MARYLVTGGAGFIGSHVVLALVERGDEVVVIDRLSQGHRAAVTPPAQLVVADLADRPTVQAVLASWRFDAVLHFAALSLVGESMGDPLRYCDENVSNALHLAQAAAQAGCKRFILSSTANVYAPGVAQPIVETAALDPSSPYGLSKLMIEQALLWAEEPVGISFASLRYFNAAGADPQGRLGEAHHPETHLVPLAIDAMLGRRPPLCIFGTDYPTPDGTCVRDYVHVSDVANAHLRVLDIADRRGRFNLGTGIGYSVREVIAAVERVSGRRVPVTIGDRRAGDPPILIASGERLRVTTGWSPKFASIDDVVATALRWREAHPLGYRSGAEREPVDPVAQPGRRHGVGALA